jgi:hypothetical protein
VHDYAVSSNKSTRVLKLNTRFILRRTVMGFVVTKFSQIVLHQGRVQVYCGPYSVTFKRPLPILILGVNLFLRVEECV